MDMKYRVKFEFYSKKMQTVIEANSPEDAKYKIMGKVKFVNIEPIMKDNDILDFFNKEIFK